MRLPTAPGEVCRYDELVGKQVRDIYQFPDGRLWIGKQNGLGEFDGERYRTYSTTEHGLSGDGINVLAEDGDGNIWVGTDTAGALKVARNGFTSYSVADGLASTWIAGIFESQAGELCVVDSQRVAISRFEASRFTAIRAT